jgi:Tfp pilus assembly protein PilV
MERVVMAIALETSVGKNAGTARERGITLIETLLATIIMCVGSLGIITLIIASVATNNRNKMDSTQTMLAESILEQIHSTFNGTGTSALTDCSGTVWVVDTTIPNTASVGSQLSGSVIAFTEANPPAGYHMNYVVRSPCASAGAIEGTYDVRWHLDQIGTTSTYLVTVSAKLKDHGEGNQVFALPVTLRFMAGS